MKLLFLFLCFGGFLSIVSKSPMRTDESKENDILQEKLKQMIDQWKSGKHEIYTYNFLVLFLLPMMN